MAGVLYGSGVISQDVFVNGGESEGGAIADVLGIPDTVGISDAQARSIIEGIAAEQAAGNDPSTNEALEQLDAEGGGTTCEGKPKKPAPGSAAAVGEDGDYDKDVLRPKSEWIIVQTHVNPRVLPEVWTKLENFAKSLDRPITLNSAHRSVEYNKYVCGATNSAHVQRKAADVHWGSVDAGVRIDMIQKAIDAGFTGIGIYPDFIHVDTGTKRHWGPNGSYTGQFAQYKPVLKANGFANTNT